MNFPRNDEQVHLLHDRFRKIVDLYNRLEKKPRRYGTGQLMTTAQIHLIEVIGDQETDQSITDLSGQMGISKGAVSQTLKRLEKRGLISKEEDPANSSRLIVNLTDRGRTAYYAHKLWHEKTDGGFKRYFSGLDREKIAFILETFDRVESFFQRLAGEE